MRAGVLGLVLAAWASAAAAEWVAQVDKSPMDDRTTLLVVVSARELTLNHRARPVAQRLMLQCSRGSVDVYFIAGMALELAGSGHAAIRLRVDDGSPRRYVGARSTDDEAMVISGGRAWIGRWRAASQVLVEFQPFSLPPRVATFDVRQLAKHDDLLMRHCGWRPTPAK